MTEITDIRIRGFKAIEELEVEPSQINLITGRNNTGKTSVLESIDLAFNPDTIKKFSVSPEKVININSESSLVDIEFYKSQRKLDEFEGSDGSNQHRSVALRQPDDEESLNIFTKVIQEILALNEEYPVRRREHRLMASPEISEILVEGSAEDFDDLVQDLLEDSLNEISEDTLLPNVTNSSLILQVDGEEFSFMYLGEFYEEIREKLTKSSISKFHSNIPENKLTELTEEQSHDLNRFLRRTFESRLAPRFGSSRFVGESPESLEGVKFVKHPSIGAEEVDVTQENAAVKISDIEDYLKDNDIVEDLNDFSFDKLVFEEEGEKYEIPYSFMGEGFRTIVGLLWELFSAERQEDVLLLEEPDVNLHPGYIENLLYELVEIVKTENIQLFITTHNLDFIEAFFSDRMAESQEEYLKQNFTIIQLTEPVPRTLDYTSAQEEIEELGIDLRGI